MNASRLICAGAWTLLAFSAHAQNMKTGLWEVQTKLGGSPEMDQAMSQMQQQMESMPPAQRKMMEDMMNRQGASMGGAAGGGMSSRMCVTKEMAERNQLPVQQKGSCTTTTSNKTSAGMKMKFTCIDPPSSGEGDFTFSGDSAYTMKMKISGVPEWQKIPPWTRPENGSEPTAAQSNHCRWQSSHDRGAP